MSNNNLNVLTVHASGRQQGSMSRELTADLVAALEDRHGAVDLVERDVSAGVPLVDDAWIDASKCDERDGQVGVVGYEIPFNRHFYQYEPPRALSEIDADLDALSKEIMQMLGGVRS